MTRTRHLREVHWSDLADLARAEEELFATDAWSEPAWWAELAGRPRRDYVAAVEGERILGYAGLDHAGEVADVMTVAVLPQARGQGLGRWLLAELAERARERGAAYLLLEVRCDNTAARRLYESAGFVELSVRPRYYQPGDVDAIVMRKTLSGKDAHGQ